MEIAVSGSISMRQSKGSQGVKREREELKSSGSPFFSQLPLLAEKYSVEPECGTLGGGTFGSILVGRIGGGGGRVALKCLHLPAVGNDSRPTKEYYARREIKALHRVAGHVNVIQLLDVRRDDADKVYLVFPLMPHDLLGLMHQHGTNMAPAQIKGYMKQLFEALRWCHSKNVLHRDVKPDNILIQHDNVLKLADFGLAREQMPDYARYTYEVQTLWYRAPELLLGATDYGGEPDLWAAGCVMGYCLFLFAVFPGKTEAEQLHLIYQLCGTPKNVETEWPKPLREAASKSFKQSQPGMLTERWGGSANVSFRKALFTRGAVQVLDAMLVVNPAHRASWNTVLTMPYFTEEHPRPYEPHEMRVFRTAQRTAKVINKK